VAGDFVKHTQTGVTLVELMVAMVLGLWLAAAALQLGWRSSQTRLVQAAYAEMNDNAQMALQLLTRDLQQAGYSAAQGVSATTQTSTLVRGLKAAPLFACDFGFAAPLASPLTCQTQGDSSALEVVFEADAHNTSPTSTGLPADCLGNAVTPTDGLYLSRHRYVVQTLSTGCSELHCAAGQSSQPLVDHVHQLSLSFGEALAAEPSRAVRYVKASEVVDWGLVVAVRVCVLMQSADRVWTSEDQATYLDCQGVRQSTSSYARQSFQTTVVLRNKSS
jgi:type IV pilus assembly protein PilW